MQQSRHVHSAAALCLSVWGGSVVAAQRHSACYDAGRFSRAADTLPPSPVASYAAIFKCDPAPTPTPEPAAAAEPAAADQPALEQEEAWAEAELELGLELGSSGELDKKKKGPKPPNPCKGLNATLCALHAANCTVCVNTFSLKPKCFTHERAAILPLRKSGMGMPKGALRCGRQIAAAAEPELAHCSCSEAVWPGLTRRRRPMHMTPCHVPACLQ